MNADRRLGRRLVIVAALLAAGCGAGHATPHPSASGTQSSVHPTGAPVADWLSFSFNGIAFRYPPSWHSYPYRWASSFSESLTYLSTVAVPDPCTTTTLSTGGIETDCGQLRSHLGPSDVLIVWTEGSFPAAPTADALVSAPGTPHTFGGHDAKVTQGQAGDECGQTGAANSITAVIALTPRPTESTIRMTACLGPDDETTNAADVMTMLATTSITG